MNVGQFIDDAVRYYNLSNPDLIIHESKCGSLTFYFLYNKYHNIWYPSACTLFLYLYVKLSKDGIYPFICLRKIAGEDKIGIFIDATKNS